MNLSAKEQDLLKAVQEVSALKVQERDLTKQLEDAQKSNDRLVKEAAKKEDEWVLHSAACQNFFDELDLCKDIRSWTSNYRSAFLILVLLRRQLTWRL